MHSHYHLFKVSNIPSNSWLQIQTLSCLMSIKLIQRKANKKSTNNKDR
ncbi:hypothetical protein VIBNIAM115_600012 [Vibrio nigripulchritudo AM115]|nr:hypothetical protein VIBNIAM115_600012 [Vibrio nigripulchritudo AM115]